MQLRWPQSKLPKKLPSKRQSKRQLKWLSWPHKKLLPNQRSKLLRKHYLKQPKQLLNKLLSKGYSLQQSKRQYNVLKYQVKRQRLKLRKIWQSKLLIKVFSKLAKKPLSKLQKQLVNKPLNKLLNKLQFKLSNKLHSEDFWVVQQALGYLSPYNRLSVQFLRMFLVAGKKSHLFNRMGEVNQALFRIP